MSAAQPVNPGGPVRGREPVDVVTPPVDGRTVLRVRDLHAVVGTDGRDVEIVRGVSFDLTAGQTVALVGESGSGKSFTALSVAGLLPGGARVTAGSVRLDADPRASQEAGSPLQPGAAGRPGGPGGPGGPGVELVGMAEGRRRRLRGPGIGMVYQDPMTSLNPLLRVGTQVAEGLTAHGWSRSDARARTLQVLGEVGLPSPERSARLYPHQLSGGMRQRVLIASALATRPRVLIADEPTTALDVTIQHQILDLVQRLRDEYGLAVLWITHDLGVVARIADRVLVMYAGRVVERSAVRAFFATPTHPYSAGLLRSLPRVGGPRQRTLPQIGGVPPAIGNLGPGCPFVPRCPQSRAGCAEAEPDLLVRGAAEAACWVPPEDWVADRSATAQDESVSTEDVTR